MTTPPDTARIRKGGWLADLTHSLAVLLSPRRAYRSLAERRPVLVPWLLVALPSMVLSLLVVSIAQRASVHLLESVDDPELVAAVAHQLQGLKAVAVLAAPFGVLLRWLVLALLLWSVGAFLLPGASVRTMLCIVACAGLPDVIGRALDLYVTWTVGPEFGPDLVPHLSPATSLTALFPELPGRWAPALLDRLTPFALWSVALWTVGVQEMFAVPRRRALAVTLPVWTLTVLVATASEVLRDSLTRLPGTLPGT